MCQMERKKGKEEGGRKFPTWIKSVDKVRERKTKKEEKRKERKEKGKEREKKEEKKRNKAVRERERKNRGFPGVSKVEARRSEN